MMTLESPVAPDEVASAASVKITGPSIVRACAIGAVERDQLALHAEALRPEFLRQPHGLALARRVAIAVGHDQNLAAQLRHVGERDCRS